MKTIKHLASIALAIGLFALAGAEALAGEDAAPAKDAPVCNLGFCMGEKVDPEATGEHPLFDAVVPSAQKNTGVCAVTGLKVVTDPDDYGTEHKRLFKNIEEMVAAKYGEPSSKYDFLLSGSLWDAPRYWRMGLRQKERELASFWMRDEVPQLPLGVASIALQAVDGAIRLRYEFENVGECTAELKAAHAEGL